MWVGLSQSVEGPKSNDWGCLKKKKFSSRLQRRLFPEFSGCWPALWISDLPATTTAWVKFMQMNSDLSLSPLYYIVLYYVILLMYYIILYCTGLYYRLCFASAPWWIHLGNYYPTHLLHLLKCPSSRRLCLSFSHWVLDLRTGSGPETGQRILTFYCDNCLGLLITHPCFLSIP